MQRRERPRCFRDEQGDRNAPAERSPLMVLSVRTSMFYIQAASSSKETLGKKGDSAVLTKMPRPLIKVQP